MSIMIDARFRNNQAGIASIMVTMIMMIVISLIVMGFAEVSRTEQRSSLDDTLSAQAYYAAESGVNDVRALVASWAASGTVIPSKTTCANTGSYSSLNGSISVPNNVMYTCELVDATPTKLHYTVGYTSTVIPLIPGNGAFGVLNLIWNVPAGLTSTAAGCDTNLSSLVNPFPVSVGGGSWSCNYPILRIDIANVSGAPIARPNWNANTSTVFLVPFNSMGVNNNVSLNNHGSAEPARCDATSCTMNINGVGGTAYYMRVTTIYQTASPLEITANGGAGNKWFADAQITVDSTGRAQDLLRRILVAFDLTNANAYKIPSAAIVTEDSICKRYGITDNSFNVYDNLTAGGGGNTLCAPQSVGTPSPP